MTLSNPSRVAIVKNHQPNQRKSQVAFFGTILWVVLLLNGCQSVLVTTEGADGAAANGPTVMPNSPPTVEVLAEQVDTDSRQVVSSDPPPGPLQAEVPSGQPEQPVSADDQADLLPIENLATPIPSEELGAAPVTVQTLLYHVVVAGDTLSAISMTYGVSVDDIVVANQLASQDWISVGQELVIPVNLPQSALADLQIDSAQAQSAPVNDAAIRNATYSCPDNTDVYPLQLSSDPIQILAKSDRLYLIADGSLYELLLDDKGQIKPGAPINLMPPEKQVDGYVIRELVYVTQDAARGDLLVLDKTNDIFRYTQSGEWRMEVAAQPIPNQFPDPQYLAIQERNGAIVALDADLSQLWQVSRQNPMPASHYLSIKIESAVDMAAVQDDSGESFYVLTREGTLLQISRPAGGTYRAAWLPVAQIGWPSQVQVDGNQLMVVDGDSRSIWLYDRATLAPTGQIVLRHPNMQRLRHVAIANQTLYAIAGRTLYVAPLAQLSATCASVVYDNNLYFDGLNVRDLLPVVGLPFPNAVLPIRPRSYPGARRLYRYGLHEGLDLYALDAPGLYVGSPVRVIANGKVTRLDADFVEMTPDEYESAMLETENQHRTSDGLADKLFGRQVHVEHSPQVVTRYGHLDTVSTGIAVDEAVEMGTTIGTVGVSGTSSGVYGTQDGAHLHFEIWVNGRYLGQGLSLYETMRLWLELYK